MILQSKLIRHCQLVYVGCLIVYMHERIIILFKVLLEWEVANVLVVSLVLCF